MEASTCVITIVSIILFLVPTCYSNPLMLQGLNYHSIPENDVDLLEFALNLEFLEVEFFLHGALGHGLDTFAPRLSVGGPSPIGARRANLDTLTRDVIMQFGWQEVGHLRAIKNKVRGIQRPLLDLRAETFANAMNKAFRKKLSPPFDPYASSLNFLLASYMIPYVTLSSYVGINQELEGTASKQVVAGVLAVISGQDAVIRAMLYKRAMEKVEPYGITVAEFTNRISDLRNMLGNAGRKDQGLVVPNHHHHQEKEQAEGKIRGNILSGNRNSLGFARSPQETLRIVYFHGDEHVAGGFFPQGANGHIATSYLQYNNNYA